MDITKVELKEIISEAIAASQKPEKLSWTIQECAEHSGIGEVKIRELVAAVNTDFPHVKIGKKTLIPVGVFQSWLYEKARNKESL